MKSSICFIANFSKTYFFHAIAQELINHKLDIYWVCSNQKLNDFLLAHYPTSNIFYFNRNRIGKVHTAIDDFKINELLYGDRVLKHDKEEGQQLLTNIQAPIYQFLKVNQISYVFGELTWAHEVLIFRMIQKRKELNCQFLNPHVVRIPNDRFAFFNDENQSQFLDLPKTEANFSEIIKIRKPDYLKINDQRLKEASSVWGRLDRIKRLITNENMDRKDPTHLSNPKARFSTRSKEEWYRETYKSIERKSFDLFKGQKYVFIGLHKQPEASVDVFGRYVENQHQNIMDIWRVLPPGWQLLVKEHSNAIGDRSPQFYKSLADLPNVHFIHEKTDSYQVIHAAQLVVTITGTIAYEAALMQVPAFTFAPTFFNRLNCCRHITVQDLNRCSSLQELIDELKAQEDNRLDFSNYLFNHSFPGIFSDPVSNPAILNEDNVITVSKAFVKVIKGKEERVMPTYTTQS
ncbi:MAG: hypothetical protein AAF985_06660 [Bacteroidota bacterium]